MTWAALIAGAFVLGSIPTGWLIGRAKGVDIRTLGSGNIGATNVLRVLGAGPGLLCFLLDMLKGLAPTLGAGLATGVIRAGSLTAGEAVLWLAVMAAPVLGHMFCPWLGFKGGKGVATGLGALLGVYPYLTIPALGALLVWLLIVGVWRYAGLASAAAAASLPVFVLVWGAWRAVRLGVPADRLGEYRGSWAPFLIATSLLAALVIVKHRGNIRRVLAGTESKVGQRARVPGAPTDRT